MTKEHFKPAKDCPTPGSCRGSCQNAMAVEMLGYEVDPRCSHSQVAEALNKFRSSQPKAEE